MPGDVTDAGTPGEIAIVKAAMEENPKARVLAVPGNHDYMTHKAFVTMWDKLFGAARIEKYGKDEREAWRRAVAYGTARIEKYGKVQLLMLDTWNGKLTDKKSNLDAIAALDEKSPVIVFSHHQLTPDTFIKDATKIIKQFISRFLADVLVILEERKVEKILTASQRAFANLIKHETSAFSGGNRLTVKLKSVLRIASLGILNDNRLHFLILRCHNSTFTFS
jgi:hypothetical protein